VRTARETGVVVRRGDRFLVLHRAHDRYWHIVAGVVEEGETFAEAAARELYEEAALGPNAPLRQVGMTQGYAVPEATRQEYGPGIDRITIESFAIDVPPDWEPVLNEEHDEYRWCTLEEALAILHWPETKEAIAAVAHG
jgi:dATP pyrophosphohydrolase